MSKRDITTRSRSTNQIDTLQVRGKAAKIAEVRETAFAALIVGLGFATGALAALDIATVPYAKEIMVTVVLFGVVEVPRLEEVSVYARLIMMFGLVGTMLLFTRIIIPNSLTVVAWAALALLVVSSFINLTAQANVGPAGAAKAATKRHAVFLGLGTVMALAALLL